MTKFVEDICGTAREELVGVMGVNPDGEEVSLEDEVHVGDGVSQNHSCTTKSLPLVDVMGGILDVEGVSSEDESNEGGNSDEEEGVSSENERNKGDGVPYKHSHMTMNLPPLTRPSDYLRSRCPLCFGGKSSLAEG